VLPQVPTIAESGVPGFDISAWYGVFAAAGTPAPIVQKLNAEIIKAMDGLQGQMTSNPTSFAQRGAVIALTGSQEPTHQMREEFAKRRRRIVDRLNDMPGIRCHSPEGAFYVFPNIARLYHKRYQGKPITNSTEFSAFLLDAARIAVVPGVEFGNDNHIRISYATSMAQIEKGMDRMAEAIAALG